MIKEAIDKVLSLAPATLLDIGDRKYSDKTLVPVKEPQPGAVQIGTLQGLVDLVNASVENFDPKEVLVHVVDHGHVNLIGRVSDKWGSRLQLISVSLPQTTGFNFGSFQDHESFIIGVQANFTADGDRDYVLRIASNITTEQVKTSNDDGISQQVGQRAGVALVGTETLKGRVTLSPFRTFREIQQPLSEFVFRVKQAGDGKPTLALFEADGGKWKIDAVESIARYLRVAVSTVQVIA